MGSALERARYALRRALGLAPADANTTSDRREFAAYVAVAVAGVLPALLHPGAIVGDGVDAYGSHWFYWWMRACIAHLWNPAWTNFFFYPSGKDVFAHTGLNLVDATLSVPFQWALGPTLYQPVFIVVLQLGNAVAMRALAQDIFPDKRTVFATTLLWMTNPYVLFELTEGRPTQALLWFVPTAMLYLRRAARAPGWRNPVGLGLSVGLAGWTYWFNGYFLVLSLIPLALFELADARDRLRVLARWAVGTAVCLLLVAPAVWQMADVYREGGVPGLADGGGVFQPPSGIGEGAATAHRGLWQMEANGAPQFLQPAWGLPLLLALLGRGVPLARARWAAVLAVAGAIAIGPVLVASADPVLWSPYMVLYRILPFFERLWFPYRALGVASVPASLLLGAWAARSRWLPGALVALSLGGQAVVAVWPLNWHVAASPPMLTALRAEGGGLIFLPFKFQHEGLMWQTEFQLPTFGGMGESAPATWPDDLRSRLSNGFIRGLRGAMMVPPQPAFFAPPARAEIEGLGFRWVAVRVSLLDAEIDRVARANSTTPGAAVGARAGGAETPERRSVARADAIDRTSHVVGSGPVGIDGDVVLWDLQGAWRAPASAAYSAARLAAIPWTGEHRSAFHRRLFALGRAPTDNFQTPSGRPPRPVPPSPAPPGPHAPPAPVGAPLPGR